MLLILWTFQTFITVVAKCVTYCMRALTDWERSLHRLAPVTLRLATSMRRSGDTLNTRRYRIALLVGRRERCAAAIAEQRHVFCSEPGARSAEDRALAPGPSARMPDRAPRYLSATTYPLTVASDPDARTWAVIDP